MPPRKITIDASRLPLRFLALAVLDGVKMPMPGQMLRVAIEQRYGRTVTPKALSALIVAARARTKLSTSNSAVVPALDSMGHPIRGWYTSGAWALGDRILARSHLHAAFERVHAKLEGRPVPPMDGTEAALLTSAIERVAAQKQTKQLFGPATNEPTDSPASP
jgi:hypothetical protein